MSYTASNNDAGYNPPGPGELIKTYDLDGALSQRTLPDGRAVNITYAALMGGPLLKPILKPMSNSAHGAASNLLDALVRNPIGIGGPQTMTLLYAGTLLTRTDSIGAATGQYAFTYDNNLHLTKDQPAQRIGCDHHVADARQRRAAEGLRAVYDRAQRPGRGADSSHWRRRTQPVAELRYRWRSTRSAT